MPIMKTKAICKRIERNLSIKSSEEGLFTVEKEYNSPISERLKMLHKRSRSTTEVNNGKASIIGLCTNTQTI
jgi:hypothetical protein